LDLEKKTTAKLNSESEGSLPKTNRSKKIPEDMSSHIQKPSLLQFNCKLVCYRNSLLVANPQQKYKFRQKTDDLRLQKCCSAGHGKRPALWKVTPFKDVLSSEQLLF
jgi:hypothetical protein